MKSVVLQRNLSRAIAEGHPWIYAAALEKSDANTGDVVEIRSSNGDILGRGLKESGAIGVRVFTARDEKLDAGLFRRRIRHAAELRATRLPDHTNAYRLIHGEGDRLPGVVVDIYANIAVLRLDGEAIAHSLDVLVESLTPTLKKLAIDTLLLRQGRRGNVVKRTLFGETPSEPLLVEENGMKMLVDVIEGQKTGLFLDQRDARHRVRRWGTKGPILNLYSYTGGFSVAGGLGGAHRVTSVDVAKGAIDFAERTWLANGLNAEKHIGKVADVDEFLLSERSKYELVIADPPSFAPNEDAVPSALKSYRKLHQRSLRLVAPGGLYLAASCSSHVDHNMFLDSVRQGAAGAGLIVQVLDRWRAPFDHPFIAAMPQSDYLKGVVVRVVD